MDAKEVKAWFYGMGADLCGIAGMERFENTPAEYHPREALPSCSSVIVFAKRFLAGTIACNSKMPYTIVRNILSDKMDAMAVEFCDMLERQGVLAIPTDTNGPSEFDEETQRYSTVISSIHCAVAAGLGVIGKNTLLITPEYGNMVWLNVILTELPLESDAPIENEFCHGCDLCVKACPVHAVGGAELKQAECWNHTLGVGSDEDAPIQCHRCRDACPYCFGTENRNMRRDFRQIKNP